MIYFFHNINRNLYY